MLTKFPDALFANNPWKEPALFTSAGGRSREIEGVYTKENSISSIGGVAVQNAKPQFDVPTIDVPDANNRCTLLVYSLFRNLLTEDGRTLLTENGQKLSAEGNYERSVIEVLPDGEGTTALVLSLHE